VTVQYVSLWTSAHFLQVRLQTVAGTMISFMIQCSFSCQLKVSVWIVYLEFNKQCIAITVIIIFRIFSVLNDDCSLKKFIEETENHCRKK